MGGCRSGAKIDASIVYLTLFVISLAANACVLFRDVCLSFGKLIRQRVDGGCVEEAIYFCGLNSRLTKFFIWDVQ